MQFAYCKINSPEHNQDADISWSWRSLQLVATTWTFEYSPPNLGARAVYEMQIYLGCGLFVHLILVAVVFSWELDKCKISVIVDHKSLRHIYHVFA